MHFSTRTILRMAVVLLACAFTATPQANTTTYQFVGQCSDCTGTGTGLLVLQNYTRGTAISSSNFVSFTYSSNLINFSISSAQLNSITGSLPASLPATANLFFNGNGINNQLQTTLQNLSYPGWWCAGATCSADYGLAHTWSLYSAPSAPTAAGAPAMSETLLLCLAAGIAVMGGMLLKRRTTGAN